MAPPGIWPISPTTLPIDSTRPISHLGPFLRGEIDGDERAEAGLHVGEKEDEPVEAAQALASRDAACRRRNPADVGTIVIRADRAPLAIVILALIHNGTGARPEYRSSLPNDS